MQCCSAVPRRRVLLRRHAPHLVVVLVGTVWALNLLICWLMRIAPRLRARLLHTLACTLCSAAVKGSCMRCACSSSCCIAELLNLNGLLASSAEHSSGIVFAMTRRVLLRLLLCQQLRRLCALVRLSLCRAMLFVAALRLVRSCRLTLQFFLCRRPSLAVVSPCSLWVAARAGWALLLRAAVLECGARTVAWRGFPVLTRLARTGQARMDPDILLHHHLHRMLVHSLRASPLAPLPPPCLPPRVVAVSMCLIMDSIVLLQMAARPGPGGLPVHMLLLIHRLQMAVVACCM